MATSTSNKSEFLNEQKNIRTLAEALENANALGIKKDGQITEELRLSALRALDKITEISENKSSSDEAVAELAQEYLNKVDADKIRERLVDAENAYTKMLHSVPVEELDVNSEDLAGRVYESPEILWKELNLLQTAIGNLSKELGDELTVNRTDKFLIGHSIKSVLNRACVRDKKPTLTNLAVYTDIDRSTLYRWLDERKDVYSFRNSIEKLKSLPKLPKDDQGIPTIPNPFTNYRLYFDYANGKVEFIPSIPGAVNDPVYHNRLRAMGLKYPDFIKRIKNLSSEQRNELNWADICEIYQEFDLVEEVRAIEDDNARQAFEIKQQLEAKSNYMMPLNTLSDVCKGSTDSMNFTVRPMSLKDKNAYGLKVDTSEFEPVIRINSTCLVDEDAVLLDDDLVVVSVLNDKWTQCYIGKFTGALEKFSLSVSRPNNTFDKYVFNNNMMVSDSNYITSKECENYYELNGGFFQLVYPPHKIVAVRF